MQPKLRFHVLGGAEIKIEKGLPLRFSARRAEVLLTYLALDPRMHPREVLATMLWDDREHKQALANFRSLLAQLPKAVKPFLQTTRHTVGLQPDQVWVDALVFETMSEGNQDAGQLDAAISLYRGDFLEGVYVRESRGLETWMSFTRKQLRQIAVEVHYRRAQIAFYRGDYTYGVRLGETLTQMDPLNEAAHRLLMRLLARAGKTNAALVHFNTCREVLEENLGIAPSAETELVYHRIKAVKDSIWRFPNPSTTPFVGRKSELAALFQELDRSDARVQTITGVGGVGKTRIALQAAFLSRSDFRDGAFFTPLASTDDPNVIPALVAKAVGCKLEGKAPPQEQLLNFLEEKELLLVLDNLEHLLPNVLGMIREILERAPQVNLLVTSREPMRLVWESVVPLSGLQSDESMDLFLAFGKKKHPALVQSQQNEPAIKHICTLVDGLPLGIELAASWIPKYSVDEIASEIEGSSSFLTSHELGRPDRHVSLEAVFEYSWKRLHPTERQSLIKLSVFRGGFSREAAASVAGATRPILNVLADKSLIAWDLAANRYRMLRVLRMFLDERWESPFRPGQAYDIHRQYFAALLKETESKLKKTTRNAALETLSSDLENIRHAWHTASSGKDEIAGKLAPFIETLYAYYHLQGWYQDGYDLFGIAVEKLSAVSQSTERTLQLSRLRVRQGNFATYLGRLDKAYSLLEQGLEAGRPLFSPRELSAALISFSQAVYLLGDYDASESAAEEAHVVYQTIEDSRGMVTALRRLANISMVRGDYQTAMDRFEICLQISQRDQDEKGIARGNNALANIKAELGDYEAALAHYRTALGIYRAQKDRFGTAIVLNNIGTIENELGKYDEAVISFRESYEICKEIRDEVGMGVAQANEGLAYWKLGTYHKAWALYTQSIEILGRINTPYMLALAHFGLGRVALSMNKIETARESFRATLIIAKDTGAMVRKHQGVIGFALLFKKEGRLKDALRLAKTLTKLGSLSKEVEQEVFKLVEDLPDLDLRAQSPTLDNVIEQLLG